jgi:hypothetical protein
MSHFSTVKTCLRDQVLLEQALTQLGHTFQTGEHLVVVGEKNEQAKVQLAVTLPKAQSAKLQLGFARTADGTFAACGEWYNVERATGLNEQAFLNAVRRTYAQLAVRRQAAELGYVVESEKVLANGEIELVLSEPA